MFIQPIQNRLAGADELPRLMFFELNLHVTNTVAAVQSVVDAIVEPMPKQSGPTRDLKLTLTHAPNEQTSTNAN
jgi:hypothetical protein